MAFCICKVLVVLASRSSKVLYINCLFIPCMRVEIELDKLLNYNVLIFIDRRFI